MVTEYHCPGRYASTARMSPDGCHAPFEYDRKGLPQQSVSCPLPSSAIIITGCSPFSEKPLPSNISIQAGVLLSESITTLRWWWMYVLLCGRGCVSRIVSQ